MVPIDERTKRRALRQLAHPINSRWAREGLRHTKNCEEKSKDGNRPHNYSQPVWRIDKHECRREKDQQRHQLNQNQTR